MIQASIHILELLMDLLVRKEDTVQILRHRLVVPQLVQIIRHTTQRHIATISSLKIQRKPKIFFHFR